MIDSDQLQASYMDSLDKKAPTFQDGRGGLHHLLMHGYEPIPSDWKMVKDDEREGPQAYGLSPAEKAYYAQPQNRVSQPGQSEGSAQPQNSLAAILQHLGTLFGKT